MHHHYTPPHASNTFLLFSVLPQEQQIHHNLKKNYHGVGYN
jgi:hypothetical protein